MNHDVLLFLEISYLICALICPILYAMCHAWELHAQHYHSGRYYPKPEFKEHFTYGRVIVGFGLGIIPFINAFVIFFSLWDIVRYMGQVYDSKAVFKKKDKQV